MVEARQAPASISRLSTRAQRTATATRKSSPLSSALYQALTKPPTASHMASHRILSSKLFPCLFLVLVMACCTRGATPVVPLAGGKYLTVGSTSDKFNYGWNPKVDYSGWASAEENAVYAGDVLVFNYPAYSDEVYKFDDEAAYKKCQFWRATKVCGDTDGEAGCTVRVDQPGQALFASGMIARCTWVSKLNITVIPRGTPRNILVGKAMPGYSYPWNPAVNFTAWAATTTVYIGDSLIFKFPAGVDEVYKVPTQTDYDSCDVRNYEMMCRASDAVYGCKTEPLTADPVFFISGVYSKCAAGVKVTVTAVAPPTTGT